MGSIDEQKLNNFTFKQRYRMNKLHGRNTSTINNSSIMMSSTFGAGSVSRVMPKKKLLLKSNLTLSNQASLDNQKLAVQNLDSSKFLTNKDMARINENTGTYEGRTNQLNSNEVSLDGRNFNTI